MILRKSLLSGYQSQFTLGQVAGLADLCGAEGEAATEAEQLCHNSHSAAGPRRQKAQASVLQPEGRNKQAPLGEWETAREPECKRDTNGYNTQVDMARFTVDSQLFNSGKAEDAVFTGT
ncbi:hypothetical protein MHYP_G00341920 [Metynnis hypsauchen]